MAKKIAKTAWKKVSFKDGSDIAALDKAAKLAHEKMKASKEYRAYLTAYGKRNEAICAAIHAAQVADGDGNVATNPGEVVLSRFGQWAVEPGRTIAKDGKAKSSDVLEIG
jgi:hypothetical protein